MTKRIMALLLVLVGLLACCTAMASGETQANYKDNQNPVIGEIKLSKTTAIVKKADINAIYEPDNIYVTAEVTDEGTDPQNINVIGNLECYEDGGLEYIIDNWYVEFRYDPENKNYKANIVFDGSYITGDYELVVTATDLYGNISKKTAPQVIHLVNDYELEYANIPVITGAEVTLARSGDVIIPTVTMDAYVEMKDGILKDGVLFNVTCSIGNDEGDIWVGGPYAPKVVDGKTTMVIPDPSLDNRVEPGMYTFRITAHCREGSSIVSCIYSIPFEITRDMVGTFPTVTELEFPQNGLTLTKNDTLTMSLSATGLQNIIRLKAAFRNTTTGGLVNILMGGTADGSEYLFKGDLQLSLDRAEGEYVLEAIYMAPTLSNYYVKIYTPTTPIGFTYKDEVVNIYKIELPELDPENVRSEVNVTLFVGEKYNVKYNLLPDTKGKAIDNPKLNWSIAEAGETIASVDENGVITALTMGETYVYVNRFDNNETVRRTIKVTVKQRDITEIKLDKSEIELSLGIKEEEQLNYLCLPENVTRTGVAFHTSDDGVATVDQNGLVKAVGEGTCYIQVTSIYNNAATNTCKVTVKNVKTQDIRMSEETLTLNLMTCPSYKLSYVVTPEEITKPGVVWSSKDDAVATVDQNGVVTAHSAGKTVIYVTPVDGADVLGECEVNVEATQTVSIRMTSNKLTLEYDETSEEIVSYSLTYTAYPDGIYNLGVVWSSSNPDVAKVDEYGVVTAVSEGTAIITATAIDGYGPHDSCEVTVVRTAATVISFPTKVVTIRLEKGKKSQITLKPRITPSTASYKLRWSSSNPRIATVKNGVVTGHRAGICRVTCAIRGTQLKATVKVKVVKK